MSEPSSLSGGDFGFAVLAAFGRRWRALEAVIKAARARQRRRRITLAILLIVAASISAYFTIDRAGSSASTSAPGTATPDQPIALAVSPDGALFIADRGRNEILERMPSGGFRVVAGTGAAGLTGDGGPAVRAEINNPGGLVFASNGTLFFTQAGRYRAPISSNFGGIPNTAIREITPSGTIHTVAGLQPKCASVAVSSIPAHSALFYGASVSVSATGALAVGATLCVGKSSDKGFGPSLLLTSSGRFVRDGSNPVPAVASIACGSGVQGQGFQAFACGSGGGSGPDGHGQELLVVRSDGSSVAFPDHQGNNFAVVHGEVLASYNQTIVRVTSNRLVPLVTDRQLQKALGLQPRSRPLTDVAGLTIGHSGDIYFVASTISHRGCQNAIVERTASGVLHRIWGSEARKHNVCF